MSEAHPNGTPYPPVAGRAYGQQPYDPQQPHDPQPPYAAQPYAPVEPQAGQAHPGQPYGQPQQPYQGEPYWQAPGEAPVQQHQPQQYQQPYEAQQPYEQPQPYAGQPAGQPYEQSFLQQAFAVQPSAGQARPPAEPAPYAPQGGHPSGPAQQAFQPPYAQQPPPQQFPHQVPGQPPVPPGPPGPARAASPASSAAHRTGSPIIEPGLQPALITAGVAALLAGGAALGSVPLALTVVLLQVLTAAGWFRLNGMWPARQGIALAALAGFTADAAVLLAHGDAKAAAVVGTLGGFFLLVLVLQTFRPSDPAERFYALTVLGSATVVTVLCAALLFAAWVPAAMAAVALATVLAALPLPAPKAVAPVLGLLVAAAFGLLVGAPAALGALAGVGALVGRRVAAYDWPSRFVHMTAGVALPLAVASPLIWIGSSLLAG